MPRDSNGNASTDPVYVATPGTTIRAVQHNTPIADIIQMLTGSLARNGTGGMLADLAMGGFKITGLANGSSAQDAVTKAQLDATLNGLPQLGAWTNVASASTVDLGAQESRNLVITGTTTITSFGTAGASDNVPYLLRFAGALTLTNGANLILPGGANIVTAAGDVAIIVHDDADTWRVAVYSRAAMPPLVSGTSANNLVALDGAGRLPPVDGSLLTGIGRKLISTTNIVAAAVQDIVLPDGYSAFELVLSGNPGTNYVKIQLRPTGGSLLTGATDYKGCLSGGAGSTYGSTGLAAGTDSWRNCYVAMTWAHSKVLISDDGTLETRHYSTSNNSGAGFGACQTPGPYDLVRLTPSAGTLTCTCHLYGIKDAS